MQEEVTGKSIALIVDGARMSEQVLEKAINAYLDARKNKQPKIYHGKQSLKQLARQNAGLANIEITEKNINALAGHPLFWKENFLHDVYGQIPANFQVQTVPLAAMLWVSSSPRI